MYPPPQFQVTEGEPLYRVIDAAPLATLICQNEGEIFVTDVPLLLDRARGELGTLVGHMDRANPHSRVIDGREVVAVFHGPDCYISPTVYLTPQLPTWNSVKVHVRGRAVTSSPAALRRSLIWMAERLEQGRGFVLGDEDPRLDHLLPHIVGFEIGIRELEGRSRLSQDKPYEDRNRAFQELMRNTGPSGRALLETSFRQH